MLTVVKQHTHTNAHLLCNIYLTGMYHPVYTMHIIIQLLKIKSQKTHTEITV